MESAQPNTSVSGSLMSLSPPTPTTADTQVTSDYAATAQILNDIFSLDSDALPTPAHTTQSATTGSASRTRPGPQPVPELQLAPLDPDGPLTPDFFASSKSKRHLKWSPSRH